MPKRVYKSRQKYVYFKKDGLVKVPRKAMLTKRSPKLPISTEHQEQVAFFELVGFYERWFPELSLIFHIPNGGYRAKATAIRFQQAGVKKGVPDIFVPIPRNIYHGLWIEMKSATGKPTIEQTWYIDKLTLLGYKAVICYGSAQAWSVLCDYLDITEEALAARGGSLEHK